MFIPLLVEEHVVDVRGDTSNFHDLLLGEKLHHKQRDEGQRNHENDVYQHDDTYLIQLIFSFDGALYPKARVTASDTMVGSCLNTLATNSTKMFRERLKNSCN
jgi:hypothetical protein